MKYFRLNATRPKDPTYPDMTFYCWHCALMEGVLTSFPDLGADLNVKRIAWPRQRVDLVELLGEDHQSLPVLVLSDGGFIDDKDAILEPLTKRHGYPFRHP
ncbi:DUF3088 family protein [Roseibium alexandrii]|nr:DUF3088 family protein [Roseibium alexandrii]